MIHHGDCLDVMAGMEPESVDAVCTDGQNLFGGITGRDAPGLVRPDVTYARPRPAPEAQPVASTDEVWPE